MIKFVAVLLAFLYSGASLAASATVQSLTGNVTAALGEAAPTALAKGSALESGATVTTGDNSNIVMKFEDGQVVALNANTTFKITRYQFNAAQPQNGNAFFSLVKGAMRSISGLIGKHNSSGFRLQTPVATIGIRGTDFMAATGSLYLQVINGTVSATSSTGTAAFTAGQTGFVSTLSTLPTSIAASQLPASVTATFSQLGAMPMTGVGSAAGGTSGSGASGGATSGGTATGGSAAGGTAATSAAAGGGLGTTAVAAGAAGIAAAAAIAGQQAGAGTPVTATVTQ